MLVTRATIILRRHRWLAVLTLGLMISNVGGGLTYVAVYGTLAHLHASAVAFACAYVVSVLPALLASTVATRVAHKYSAYILLTVAQIFAAIALIVPALAISTRSISLLILSDFAPSLATGFATPLYYKLLRERLRSDEMDGMAAIHSLSFTLYVTMGVGLGTLYFDSVNALTYLGIDGVSYLVACTALLAAGRMGPQFKQKFALPSRPITGQWKRWSPIQRRVVLIMPLLSTIGAAPLALLPAIGASLGTTAIVAGFSFTPTVGLLFARSVGQLLGPLVMPERHVHQYVQDARMSSICIVAFYAAYLLIANSSSIWLMLPIVIGAHVVSNFIYTSADYHLLAKFEVDDVARASALSYQCQLVVLAVMSLAAGFMATSLGYLITIALLSGVGVVVFVSISARSVALE